ncbi:MAG: zf-TFIIB domain-containing protein [Nocardioidaceae bacterium]|nr:zf-TFIIB domain-containing protein [Nocardioidaceae bacterium]
MTTLTCPKCQSAMRAYERNGVTVDQCTECRGIFLDRGELEHLVEADARAHPADAAPAASQPPPRRDEPRRDSRHHDDDDDDDDRYDHRYQSDHRSGHGSGHGSRSRKSWVNELFG